MKTILEVKLQGIDEVKRFVQSSGASACNVDVSTGRYVVDGTSLLGVLSIDLSKTLTVTISTDLEKDITMLIESYRDCGINIKSINGTYK